MTGNMPIGGVVVRPVAGPHHDGSALYVDNPEPMLGEVVTVFLRAPAGVRDVAVRTTPDGEPTFVPARPDARRAGGRGERWWRAEVPVRNPVTGYRFLAIGADGHTWVNAQGTCPHDVPDAYDFRLVTDPPPPTWARDAVVYQIFPDRFARSAAADRRDPPDWAVPCDWDTPVVGRGPTTPYQFYGGDLDGIAERLDHIARLGANTVYLTPIFPARSNHRYDAASFDTVDPLLGGDAALDRLATAVHSRGMRLLGDVTTNHCGSAHPWFVSAANGGPERGMFYFDADGGYESWCGVSTLPKLNWGSADLRARFVDGPDSVVARWLSAFDGWRIDVANMTGRRAAEDRTHEVARLLRAATVAARPDALIVAEHGHDFTGDLDRAGWHGTMNYAGFTRPVWSWLRADELDLPDYPGAPYGIARYDGARAVAAMRAFNGLVSWRSVGASWTILGSHDTPRIATVVGSADRVEVAVGLLMTMPGTPMVFAGDEFGLTGGNGEASRTPMPWDRATLGYYRDLIALRRANPALRAGGLRWVCATDDVMVFLRESVEQTLLVYARRAPGASIAVPWDVCAADNVYGGAELSTTGGVVVLPGDGPTFQVWSLPTR